ncbi:MAG: hypothetical protein IT426_13600 [Pirellulales bacterium]|nr:hypothetical protein [Pirellulales bacterium]
MKSKSIGFAILFLLIALNLGLSGYYYAVLPSRVASEFDLSGEPKTEMAKGTFVIFNVMLMIALPAFLLAVAWICTKLPNWMIDLPHKDYWLAPERKAETAARIFGYLLWLTNGIELFLTALVGLVYRANLGHPDAMRIASHVLLACFLLFMAGWLFCFYRKFKRVPKT